MKQTIFFLFSFLFSLGAFAQTDSSKITQTTTQKQLHVLHFLGAVDWSNTDVINLLIAFAPQYDSLDNNKAITLTIPSGLIAEGMQRLSQLPEGQANEYNLNMLAEVLPQITNPWLGSRMQIIQQVNFAARDHRIKTISNRVKQIKTVQ